MSRGREWVGFWQYEVNLSLVNLKTAGFKTEYEMYRPAVRFVKCRFLRC